MFKAAKCKKDVLLGETVKWLHPPLTFSSYATIWLSKISRRIENDTGARLAFSWQLPGLSEPHKAVLSEETLQSPTAFFFLATWDRWSVFLGGQRYIEMVKKATSCLVQCQKGQGQGHGDSLHPWSTSQLLVVTPLNDDRLVKISKFFIARAKTE